MSAQATSASASFTQETTIVNKDSAPPSPIDVAASRVGQAAISKTPEPQSSSAQDVKSGVLERSVAQKTAIQIHEEYFAEQSLQENIDACTRILALDGIHFDIAPLAARFPATDPSTRASPIGNALAVLMANHEVAFKNYEKAGRIFQQKVTDYTTPPADKKRTPQDEDLALDAMFTAHVEVYNAITSLLVAKALIARPTFSGKIEDVLTFPQRESVKRLALTIYSNGCFILCKINTSQGKEHIVAPNLGFFAELKSAQFSWEIPLRNTNSCLHTQDNPRNGLTAMVDAIDTFKAKKAQEPTKESL